MNTLSVPVTTTDEINAQILAVSEDKIQGFQPDPIGEIARAVRRRRRRPSSSASPAMLRAGTIRRVRQTLMATNLARGALVAWQVPEEKLHGGVRLHVPERPVLRPRRHPLDRRSRSPARSTGCGRR